MTTKNPQAIEKSHLPAEADKPARDKLAILSAFSAVLAALLSAFVSLWVTSIQSDVEELVASKHDTIERAKLFRDLIQDLNTEDKAGYALLTLWKIYQQEEDRQVVVLAALESPHKKTIMTLTRLGFDKELEKYADTIQNLAILGTGEASKAASNIILQTFSPLQVAKYLLDKINNFGASGPYDENVIRLIELINYNKEVKQLVNNAVNGPKGVNPIIAYVQYRTGEKSTFIQYLDEVKKQPSRYDEYIELVSELKQSEFTDEDWLLVTDVAIAILQNDTVTLEPYLISGAFDVIGSNKLLNYKNNKELKEKIFQLSQQYILRNDTKDTGRYTALESLKNWSPVEAVKTIAKYLACGHTLGSLAAVSVEDLLDIEEVQIQIPPAIEGTSEEWMQWLKKKNGNKELICKP